MSFGRTRRLDDRIRELCIEALAAKDSPKVTSILNELQSAIHQYTQRLRARGGALLTGRHLLPDRRRNSGERKNPATS